jgi:hypothetical protein
MRCLMACSICLGLDLNPNKEKTGVAAAWLPFSIFLALLFLSCSYTFVNDRICLYKYVYCTYSMYRYESRLHIGSNERISFSTGAFLPQQSRERMTLRGTHRMIRRPDHSPWIDVEQGTSSSRAIRRVARSVFKASLLVCLHVMGNRPMITSGNKR